MADSKIAVAITIQHEGGFQKDPGDPGNWTGGFDANENPIGELKGTKYGISAHEFPDLDIENLTVEQVVEIFVTKYWNPLYTQIVNQSVANKISDLGFLLGVGEVVEILQIVLNLSKDGAFGSRTLAAVNAAEPVSLLRAYKTACVSHAIGVANARPSERKYLTGWINRINS